MCTVTYLPTKNGDFILTSSRDEKNIRPSALTPQEYAIEGKKIIFPKDPQAGGTWIAYSENRIACLLNGGFTKHIPTPPYKKSRGLMLLDFFSYSNAEEFVTKYDFTGIEPFTLILVEKNNLIQLRWDTTKISTTLFDASKPAIWSSSTLYSDETILNRKNWFNNWLSDTKFYDIKSIRLFHSNAGDGDIENDILMNRNDLMKTVCITSIEKNNNTFTMLHKDLISQQIHLVSA